MVKYCTNCGSELEKGAAFCGKCGNKVGETKNVNNEGGTTQPVNQQQPQQNINPTGQHKSKIAAGLLGIFLGVFGIHNFYLGYNGKAIAQLLISVLTCFIFSPVSAIWGLIEGILILTGEINQDAQGNTLVE